MYNNINSPQLLFGWLSCSCGTYLYNVIRGMIIYLNLYNILSDD